MSWVRVGGCERSDAMNESWKLISHTHLLLLVEDIDCAALSNVRIPNQTNCCQLTFCVLVCVTYNVSICVCVRVCARPHREQRRDPETAATVPLVRESPATH